MKGYFSKTFDAYKCEMHQTLNFSGASHKRISPQAAVLNSP
jgi:hypothetical protein